MLTHRNSAIDVRMRVAGYPLDDDFGDRSTGLDGDAEVAVDDAVRAATDERRQHVQAALIGDERLQPGVVAVEDAEPAAELDEDVATCVGLGGRVGRLEAPPRSQASGLPGSGT